MGLSHEQAAEQQANLNPPPPAPVTTNITEDATIGNELTLRGIPVVGSVGGAILGTRPGIDTLTELQRSEQDLHEAMMRKARANLKRTRRKDHP